MNHGTILACFLVCTIHLCPVVSVIRFCESDVGSCVNFTVTNCKSEAPLCMLRRGSSVEVDISFKPTENVEKVKAVVDGIVAGLHVPFPLPNPDGCKGCGLSCPLAKDGTYNYKTSLPIKKNYPTISVTVLWQLEDGDGKVICCAEIPSRISRSTQETTA